MSGITGPHRKILSPRARMVLGVFFVAAGALVVFGAATIPFLYESPSIQYKFGFDKTLLRTGKIFGMTAGALLLLQLSMSARLKSLDRVFSLNRLLSVHRLNAVVLAVLALLHPLFVFAPEDLGIIPVSLEYLPEILGGGLLLLIWFLTASGLWRRFLDLPFHKWWLFHRVGTAAAVAALAGHVLFVSESFESGLPRVTVFAAVGLYAFLLVAVKIKPLLMWRNRYRITRVISVGRDTFSIALKPETGPVFDYSPGQFAFLTFQSLRVSKEEHPFSISSTPTRTSCLEFNIRCSGDWTGAVGRLETGDTARIDGPYGLFGLPAVSDGRELIMIAGGIGITPMLSMLRYMADMGDPRPITLIWSNQTREDILFADEWTDLEARLKGLRIIHVLTRDPGYAGETGRLDRAKLERLLSGCSRESAVFVCGPPGMMKEARWALRQAGFPRRSIHMETFRL